MIFFYSGERINRNRTRVVVIVWLFVVLILTQSYTANLTSMLTVTRLQPNIQSYKTSNAKVGCDDNTFMKKFVENELNYKSDNIKLLIDDKDYYKAFKNKSISAAFLEIPYAKDFVNSHCKEFDITGSSYTFGGLGFAFQKGSKIAYHVSEAILKLSENGMLKKLEEAWLTPSSVCSDSITIDNTDSLSFQSFWGLYLFSAVISTTSLLLFIGSLLSGYRHHRQIRGNDIDDGVWKKFVLLVKYLKDAEPGDQRLAPTSSKVMPEIEMLEEPDCVIITTK